MVKQIKPEGHPATRCLVLGAGAQGLACALRLWEQGWDVTIVAQGWLRETTSSGAGAIWEYPPFVIEPQAKAREWVLASLGPFLSAGQVGHALSGVRLRRSYYMYRDAKSAKARDMYNALAAVALPELDLHEGLPPSGLVKDGLFAHALSYRAPVICMARYLPWLANTIGQLPGIRFVQEAVKDRNDILRWKRTEGAHLVVNCLGRGAGAVFGDKAVHGVRGDLVYALAPGLEERFDLAQVSDEDHPCGVTYMIPQGDGVVALAGTIEVMAEGEDLVGPREVADSRAAAIAERCAEAFPCIGANPLVVGRWTGARPVRARGVRLELVNDELLGAVVHNYGHGGSGVVTSWGCAVEVAAAAQRVASELGLLLQRRGSLAALDAELRDVHPAARL